MTNQRKLTDDEIREANAVHLRGASLEATAFQFRTTTNQLSKRFRALGLPYAHSFDREYTVKGKRAHKEVS